MLTDQEKLAIRDMEGFAEEFIARLMVSDCVRELNLDVTALRAIRTLGPLIYIEGAGQVFKTYDCDYPKF